MLFIIQPKRSVAVNILFTKHLQPIQKSLAPGTISPSEVADRRRLSIAYA
jgi:hypothetical protein